MHVVRILAVLSLTVALSQAEPVIGPAVNQASFIPPQMVQYGVAQGAMFAVFGTDMGPADLVLVEAFPVQTELAGTSIQVTVGDVAIDCLMIFTSAGQLAAVLPSQTPVGEGTITVTYNGETSAPARIKVSAGAVGMFTLRQDGQGPGVFTDPAFAVNTTQNSFRPGDIAIAWVTGIGPRTPDDTPSPQDLRGAIDLTVLVGGEPATLSYAGPSGCCAGVDQVAFAIPAASPTGCFVPVVMTVGDAVSNFTTMSISESGGLCSDTHSFSTEMNELVHSQGELSITAAVVTTARARTHVVDAPAAALQEQGKAQENVLSVASLTGNSFTPQIFDLGAGANAVNTCSLTYALASQGRSPFSANPLQFGGLALIELLTPTGEVEFAVPLADDATPPFAFPFAPSVLPPGRAYRLRVGPPLSLNGAPIPEETTWDATVATQPTIWDGVDLAGVRMDFDTLFSGDSGPISPTLEAAMPGDPNGILQLQMSGDKGGVNYLVDCFFPILDGVPSYQIDPAVLAHLPLGPGAFDGSSSVRLFPAAPDNQDGAPMTDVVLLFDDQIALTFHNRTMPTFDLWSTGFAAGETIPERYTCESENLSPSWNWANLPEGTESLLFAVTDADAPGGQFVHQVLYDIPPDGAIAEGFQAGDIGVSGGNSFGESGYGGPCPPPGDGAHRYVFTAYALGTPSLGLPEGAPLAEAQAAAGEDVLGMAQYVGTFGR